MSEAKEVEEKQMDKKVKVSIRAIDGIVSYKVKKIISRLHKLRVS